MPTYEYVCKSCGHEWEFEQSIKAEPQKICQKCNKETAQRQISKGVGFILKGSGWYADLYSSSSNKEPAKTDAAATSSEGSSEKKADASGGDAKKTTTDSSTTPTTTATPAATPTPTKPSSPSAA